VAQVLIFGGTGFIGSHLARHCLDLGDEVAIAARPESNPWRLADLHGRLKIHSVALSDRQALVRLFYEVRADHVFFLAAQAKRPPKTDFSDVNDSINEDLFGLLNVLSACAAGGSIPKNLVRAGSLAEYGNNPVPYVESQREKPLNAYAASMAAGTHFAQMMQPRLPFPAIHARLALCYGTTQSSDFLIPTLIRNGLARRQTVLSRPHDRRDIIYVQDVVEGLRKLAGASLPGGTIINLATGIAPSMAEIAKFILQALGEREDLIVFDEAPIQPDTTSHLCGAPDLARELIGWSAKTGFAQGLRLTVNLTKQHSSMEVE
jgi:nucleoside-diphosphate-sugar epimerase